MLAALALAVAESLLGNQTSFGGQRGGMKPFDRLSDYLSAMERRMRWLALTPRRGGERRRRRCCSRCWPCWWPTSSPSRTAAWWARACSCSSGLAFAIAAGADCAGDPPEPPPRGAARPNRTYPQFQERLLTFTERSETEPRRSVPASAGRRHACTWRRTRSRSQVAKTSWIFSFSSAAVVSTLALLWLGTSGPGFLGYGTGLLWGSVPKGVTKPFYCYLR